MTNLWKAPVSVCVSLCLPRTQVVHYRRFRGFKALGNKRQKLNYILSLLWFFLYLFIGVISTELGATCIIQLAERSSGHAELKVVCSKLEDLLPLKFWKFSLDILKIFLWIRGTRILPTSSQQLRWTGKYPTGGSFCGPAAACARVWLHSVCWHWESGLDVGDTSLLITLQISWSLKLSNHIWKIN